jgi:putative transposase
MVMAKYRLGTRCVSNLNYHVVFCPKRKRSVLTGDLATELEQIIHQTCTEINTKIDNLQIFPDSVHLFISCSARPSVDYVIKQIKSKTANILMKKYRDQLKLPSLWSSSYYCCSLGQVSESVVKQYIENQKGR